MNSLHVVKTLEVNDSIFVGSNLAEDDYPAYDSQVTYQEGARVVVASEHKVYESLQAGNIGKSPSLERLWWVGVGPTNRWKMFDLSSMTQTKLTSDTYYELRPGQAINAIAFINISGIQSIRVRLMDAQGVAIYDKVYDTSFVQEESSWYSWFFGSRSQPHTVYAHDLPTYPTALLRVDLAVAVEGVLGSVVFGSIHEVGGYGVRVGARVGIQEFSRKERNQFGDAILVRRPYAKRMNLSVVLDNRLLDSTFNLLADISATPCLWVASERFSCMTIFGFINNFEVVIPYATHSDCSIDIEGLT